MKRRGHHLAELAERPAEEASLIAEATLMIDEIPLVGVLVDE